MRYFTRCSHNGKLDRSRLFRLPRRELILFLFRFCFCKKKKWKKNSLLLLLVLFSGLKFHYAFAISTFGSLLVLTMGAQSARRIYENGYWHF